MQLSIQSKEQGDKKSRKRGGGQNLKKGTLCQLYGPNIIPIKTFKKELPKQFSDIINISFSTCLFHQTIQIAKLISVFQKGW